MQDLLFNLVCIERFYILVLFVCCNIQEKYTVKCISIPFLSISIHLLTGYEGNSTSIVPKVPTIFCGNAEDNSWYRGDN
jgi:hypothetical protein